MMDPEAFQAFHNRLLLTEWEREDTDGEPILMADVGGVACSVWPDRKPVEWSVIIAPLEGQSPEFVRTGTTKTVEGAKEAAMNLPLIHDMLRKTFGFILGEIDA